MVNCSYICVDLYNAEFVKARISYLPANDFINFNKYNFKPSRIVQTGNIECSQQEVFQKKWVLGYIYHFWSVSETVRGRL